MDAADSPLTVLVVDDEEDILELLGEYLRARGFGLKTAYDGEAALEIVRGGDVDIVLTDMNMPHMGGLELLERVAALSRPVGTIIMTGYGTVDTAIATLKAGAYDYLLKPFRLREVHSALVRASQRLAAERETARMRDLLAFYELAHGLDDLDGLPRLFGVLASVARAETGAAEVGVWLIGPGGWDPVARGGAVQALRRLVVEAVSDDAHADAADPDAVLAVPLRVGGRRVGAIAVAGRARASTDHRPRLLRLGRALGDTLARLEWRSGR